MCILYICHHFKQFLVCKSICVKLEFYKCFQKLKSKILMDLRKNFKTLRICCGFYDLLIWIFIFKIYSEENISLVLFLKIINWIWKKYSFVFKKKLKFLLCKNYWVFQVTNNINYSQKNQQFVRFPQNCVYHSAFKFMKTLKIFTQKENFFHKFQRS